MYIIQNIMYNKVKKNSIVDGFKFSITGYYIGRCFTAL